MNSPPQPLNDFAAHYDVQDLATTRPDFKSYVHDISNAVLFALERRHLEYLNLNHVPASDDVEPLQPGDLFLMRVQQLGHGVDIDRSLDVLNLQNILGTFRDGSHSFVVGLSADGAQSQLYFGARRLRSDGHSAYDFVHNLRRSIEGNLPGTRFKTYGPEKRTTCPQDEINANIMHSLQNYPYLAALTGIPSFRTDRADQFAQSLDRVIQALQGQRYNILIIAEPMSDMDVNDVLRDGLRLNSDVHSWVKVTASKSLAIGESTSDSRGETMSDGGSDSDTQGRSSGKGASKQPGAVMGGLLGAGVAMALSTASFGAAIPISMMVSSMVSGGMGGNSDNISDNDSTSKSRTWSKAVNESLTSGANRTESTSSNFEYLNKTAEYCEKVIDGHIQRLQRGKNLGMWNVGVYFLADDAATFSQGRAQLRAVYSGRESYYEPMRTLDLSSRTVRANVGAVLSTFSNPIISMQDPTTGEELRHPLGKMHRSIGTPLNTEELSVLINLPRREVPGLKLEFVADFGVNPKEISPESGIVLGKVVTGGSPIDVPVGIELGDLNRHLFVTGITGGGKTNTCFALLKHLRSRGLPFLIIEPAKGEYRDLVTDPDIGNLRVYTLGDETISPFRINPFQFVPGTNLITHLDNLKSIFNSSFPMYASMPYLLEEAVVRCYEDCGWDLVRSTNSNFDMPAIVSRWKQGEPDYCYTAYLPTLSGLMAKIDDVVASKGYGQEISGNFAAALKARISSLLLGSKGCMLNTQAGLPFEMLYDSPTVLELRGVGDDDEKCFLMALILVHLYEFREQHHRWNPHSSVRHVTVLEESHRLLGKSGGPIGASEVANPKGKAVDAFANMLAEIREYGEGFIIVDQTPAKLIPDVIKNTSTKILHRLMAPDDRDTMGDAMGMTIEQKLMIPRLRVGEAIFMTQDQDKPIWIKIPPCKGGGYARQSDDQIREHMAIEQAVRANSEAVSALRLARAGVLKSVRELNGSLAAAVNFDPDDADPTSDNTRFEPIKTSDQNETIRFNSEELDLYMSCDILFDEAAQGATKSILVNGQPFIMAIPPGIEDNQVMRFTGCGVVEQGGDSSGDLYVTVRLIDQKSVPLPTA